MRCRWPRRLLFSLPPTSQSALAPPQPLPRLSFSGSWATPPGRLGPLGAAHPYLEGVWGRGKVNVTGGGASARAWAPARLGYPSSFVQPRSSHIWGGISRSILSSTKFGLFSSVSALSISALVSPVRTTAESIPASSAIRISV